MTKGLLKFVMAAAVLAVCSVSVKAQEGADPENVVFFANLPDIGRVNLMTTADNSNEMEKLDNGWWFANFNAAETDSLYFKGYDAGGSELVLAYYNTEISEWVVYSIAFGDEWENDSYKGNPCKWIELDLTDTDTYAWKSASEALPANVKAIKSEKKKALKVIENGMIYIVKDGVKYNMLGVAQ